MTQVVQVIVPVVVIVPPPIGEVVAMLETVPVPAVWQDPSAPRYWVPEQVENRPTTFAAVAATGWALLLVPITLAEAGTDPPFNALVVVAQSPAVVVVSPVRAGSWAHVIEPVRSENAGCAVPGTPKVLMLLINLWEVAVIDSIPPRVVAEGNGRSAPTSVRNPYAAAPPLAGPASTTLAF